MARTAESSRYEQWQLAIRQARKPAVDSRVRLTGSDDVAADREQVRLPLQHWLAGWLADGSGVMWSNLDDDNTRWTAEFIIGCMAGTACVGTTGCWLQGAVAAVQT